jgi:mannose-6-phosphate isomerase-like protein (cupin superfamily)
MESTAPAIIDLDAEAAKLTMFRGRTAQTSFAERKGSSVLLGSYRDGFLLLSKFAGQAHWEVHPEDEWFYIMDGAMIADILEEDGPRSFMLAAGATAVIPKGAWHRVRSADGVTAFSATIPSDHIDLDTDDPRPAFTPAMQGQFASRSASVIDLASVLANLTMFRRTPEATAADRRGSVAELDSYRDGLVLAIKASGTDHWERHLTGDELVYLLDGAATLQIVCGDGAPTSCALRAGTVAVIPQGAWHRLLSSAGATQVAVTPFPGETIERDVEDPRGFAPKPV